MTKDAFFKSLEEIIEDPIEVCPDEMARKNMWSISVSGGLAQEISVAEFSQFIHTVVANRRSQAAKLGLGLVFYAWFDWQAAQFRFSLIAKDTSLPFQCKVVQTDDLGLIVEKFLSSEWHDGIPLGRLTEADRSNEADCPAEEEASEYQLNVFACEIGQ